MLVFHCEADVVVLGAGVAGLAYAIHASLRGLAVELIGRSDRTDQWPEVLSPEGMIEIDLLSDRSVRSRSSEEAPMINDLGGRPCDGVLTWRIPNAPEVRDFSLFHARQGRIITRGELTRGLRRSIRSLPIRYRDMSPSESNGYRPSGSAKLLVDATGVRGSSIGIPRARRYGDRALAIWMRLPWGESVDSFLNLGYVDCGWMYWMRGPGSSIDVVLVADPNWYRLNRCGLNVAMERLVRKTPFAEKLTGWGLAELQAVRDSRSSIRQHLSGEGWLAIGDAAYTLSPILGGGMARALSMARRAADASEQWIAQGSHQAIKALESEWIADYSAAIRFLDANPISI